MDDFIFVPQTGCREKPSEHRDLVRANAARKYWQEVKAGLPSQTQRIKADPNSLQTLIARKQSRLKKFYSQYETKQTSNSQRAPTGLCRSIGTGPDTLVYAGIFLDADSYELFQHYESEFKVILCDSIQPIRTSGPATCCTQAMQLQSPALIHAICFQASAHIAVGRAGLPLRQNMFKNPNRAYGLEQKALYHRAQSLSNLRQILSPENGVAVDSETSILCITLLLAAEAIMGDDMSLQSHANGLSQLVVACGGIDTLSSSTARFVRFVDVKASIAQGSAPRFDSKTPPGKKAQYSSLSAASAAPAGDEFSTFGVGFSKPPLSQQMCPYLLSCVAQIKDLTLDSLNASNYLRGTGKYDIDDFIAVEHALLSFRSHHKLSPVEECVRLALLLFTNTALWRIPFYFNWIQHLICELKTILLLLNLETATQDYTNFFLWIMFMGCYATRTGSFAERCWWSRQLNETATKAGLTTFQQAKCIVQDFAYLDEVYTMAWEQIWDDAQSFGAGSCEAERPERIKEEHPCDYHHD